MSAFNEVLLSSLAVSAVYCGICCVVHFLSTVVVPDGYKKLSDKDKFEYSNRYHSLQYLTSTIAAVTLFLIDTRRFTATLHAVFMFSSAFKYWVFLNPMMEIGATSSYFEERSIDFMMGYLWYDTIIELVVKQKPNKETLAHHVFGLISHLSARLSQNGAATFYR